MVIIKLLKKRKFLLIVFNKKQSMYIKTYMYNSVVVLGFCGGR